MPARTFVTAAVTVALALGPAGGAFATVTPATKGSND